MDGAGSVAVCTAAEATELGIPGGSLLSSSTCTTFHAGPPSAGSTYSHSPPPGGGVAGGAGTAGSAAAGIASGADGTIAFGGAAAGAPLRTRGLEALARVEARGLPMAEGARCKRQTAPAVSASPGLVFRQGAPEVIFPWPRPRVARRPPRHSRSPSAAMSTRFTGTFAARGRAARTVAQLSDSSDDGRPRPVSRRTLARETARARSEPPVPGLESATDDEDEEFYEEPVDESDEARCQAPHARTATHALSVQDDVSAQPSEDEGEGAAGPFGLFTKDGKIRERAERNCRHCWMQAKSEPHDKRTCPIRDQPPLPEPPGRGRGGRGAGRGSGGGRGAGRGGGGLPAQTLRDVGIPDNAEAAAALTAAGVDVEAGAVYFSVTLEAVTKGRGACAAHSLRSPRPAPLRAADRTAPLPRHRRRGLGRHRGRHQGAVRRPQGREGALERVLRARQRARTVARPDHDGRVRSLEHHARQSAEHRHQG